MPLLSHSEKLCAVDVRAIASLGDAVRESPGGELGVPLPRVLATTRASARLRVREPCPARGKARCACRAG